MQAMMAPNSAEERALTNIINGLDTYLQLLRAQKKHLAAEQHSQLTAGVTNMARAALNLTGGPLGRLDGGLLRQKLSEIAGIDLNASTIVQLHDFENDSARASGDRLPQPVGQQIAESTERRERLAPEQGSSATAFEPIVAG